MQGYNELLIPRDDRDEKVDQRGFTGGEYPCGLTLEEQQIEDTYHAKP